MSKDYERFKKMVENSQDWFWEFDENANFTYASPSIKSLLGYDPEEIIGLNAFDLMSPEEAERVHKHFDPVAQKYLSFTNLTNINLHKDGREVVIESSGTPIFDNDGKFLGYRGIDRDITEREAVKDALRESQTKHQNILDTSSEWVWEIDLLGRHTYSNHRLLSILGYQPEEMIGKDYLDFLHEDDLQEVKENLSRSIEKKQGWEGWVLRWRHADGSYRFLESNARPIFDSTGEIVGYSGSDRDVTERKLSEEALLRQQELLAQTQNIAQVGSWQYEVKTNQLTWSDETYRIFGIERDGAHVDYETFLEAIHPEDRATVDKAYSSSINEGQEGYQIEHRVIRKTTGETRYVHEKCRHEHDTHGAVIRSIGMVQDITDQKTNEDALLAATLAKEAANKAKSLFLAKVSHEIRTPMTAIIGFGELLEDTELTQEQSKYLAAINASSNTLSSLIDDILDFSKVDAGELTFKPQDFNVHSLIEKLVDTLRQKILTKGLSFKIDIQPEVPDLLNGDPLRIQQVLHNLLGNAIKFTEKGHIHLTVSVAETNSFRILLNISVEDTGIGIPEHLQEHIFEPFAQIADTASDYGGSGLGLAISRSLATLMGGTLRVKSRTNTGSTFNFLIPLQRKAKEQLETSPTEYKPLQWGGPPLTILLAEDNQINSQFIKTVLENMRHIVTVAENGQIALNALKTKRFDLVLLDIQMPVMNGTDVLKVIREQEQTSKKHLMVIALTAYALIGDEEKYLNLGFDDYLSKPLKTQDLVDALTRVISN